MGVFCRWDSGVEVGGEGRGEERRGEDWTGVEWKGEVR